MFITPWLRTIKSTLNRNMLSTAAPRRPKRAQKRAQRNRLEPVSSQVERLEDRTLLSVVSAFEPATQTLLIASNADDAITVTTSGGTAVQINGASPQTGTLAAMDVAVIEVLGGEGANEINLAGVLTSEFVLLRRITVDGDEGNDTITASEFGGYYDGGHGDDILVGGIGDDTLHGDDGEDTISGSDGNDSLIGEDGNDSIDGGLGNDTISSGDGADTVNAGAGNDDIQTGDDADSVTGGDGDDTINGGMGADTLDGGAGDDQMFGGGDPDSMAGGDGNDRLNGNAGIDTLDGGAGDDTLNGGVQDDSLDGGAGNDRITDTAGNDTMNGGAGDDFLNGNGGDDSIFGGDGNDTLMGGAGRDELLGEAGNDSLMGQGGADTLTGGDDADILDGGSGNDFLRSFLPGLRAGDAVINEADAGTLTLDFEVTLAPPRTETVTVDFAVSDGTATAGLDYTLVPGVTDGTLQFLPGETTQIVSVPILNDTLSEAGETVVLTLSNASGAEIPDSQGIGVIIDDDPLPSLSINNVSVAEGDGGQLTPATFTVTLSAPSGQAVTVGFATANGTATGGLDFVTTAGTVTFDVNPVTHETASLTQTLVVSVIGDDIDDLDALENYFVNLSDPVGATLADNQGIGTIIEDEGISIADTTCNEADGTCDFTVTVDPTPASGVTVTVFYGTVDGSATDGNDFTFTSGSLSFDSANPVRTVSVPLINDTTSEPAENFSVVLSNPTGATISTPSAVATIQDDDGIIISDVTLAEGDSGTRNFTFSVTIPGTPTAAVTVDYITMDGTAIGFQDYTPTSGVLTFPANTGNLTQTISVPVSGDLTDEADETFTVVLSNVQGPFPLATDTGIATILNDDGMRIRGVIVDELDPGDTQEMFFIVDIEEALTTDISVDYTTVDGNARGGTLPAGPNTDYMTTSGTLTIPAGETEGFIRVETVPDLFAEARETFEVVLSNVSPGVTFLNDRATGVIEDDDPPRTGARITVEDIVVTEGDIARFTIRASRAPFDNNNPYIISYFTGPADISPTMGIDAVSATAGVDYSTTTGTVQIRGTSTAVDVTVPITDDTTAEGFESFVLTVQRSGGSFFVFDGQASALIIDDELPAGLSNFTLAASTASAGVPADVFLPAIGGPNDDTLMGGDGDDTLIGSNFNDSLVGGPGNDSIDGGLGDDLLFGAAGKDTINGGEGNDLLSGDGNSDTLNGELGNDTIAWETGDGADAVDGDFGFDVLQMTTGTHNDKFVIGADGNQLAVSHRIPSDPAWTTVKAIGVEILDVDGDRGADKVTIEDLTGVANLQQVNLDLGRGFDSVDASAQADDRIRLELNGGGGKDTLIGGAGDDVIDGGDSNDSLTGGGGADTISGNDGVDKLFGGEGDDLLLGNAGRDFLWGENGADSLDGGDGRDDLYGGGGNDELRGGADDDSALGEAGDDVIDGGDGDDTLDGGSGNDTLSGSDGVDSLRGGDDDDSLVGGEEPDTLIGGSGDDVLLGGFGTGVPETNGNDFLNGNSGNDTLNGEAGNDTLLGGGGNDDLNGDFGDDRINGNGGNDVMAGGHGDDLIRGSGGHDTLDGGHGDDVLMGDAGNDGLAGDDGHDRLNGGSGNDTLHGGDGDDTLRGGADLDLLIGHDGADDLDGQGGAPDTLVGGDAFDTLNDNGGDDVVDHKFVFFADWIDGA